MGLLRADWDPDSDAMIPSSNVRNLEETASKFPSLPDQIPMADVSTHSSMSGGESDLLPAGFDMYEIQNWGRWDIRCLIRYIWLSSNGMRQLGRGSNVTM